MRQNKILDRLVAQREDFRKDIGVITNMAITPSLFRLVVSHAGRPVTEEDLRKWAMHKGKGRFKIVANSLREHKFFSSPFPIVSVAAEVNTIRIPYQQALADDDLVAVADNRFIDTNLGTAWAVEEVNGEKFIVKVAPDDMYDFIKENKSYKGPKAATAAVQALATLSYKGDRVRYIRPDMTVGMGSVTQVKDDGTAIIKDAQDGKSYNRPMGAVIEIVTTGPANKVNKVDLRNFFASYLGDDIANKLI